MTPPHIIDVGGATRVERLHHGSAAVAQALRRVWMNDFRRDRPLHRPLASRSRCSANRSIRRSGAIVGSTAVYVIIHLLLAETCSENRRSFTALTTEEAPAAGLHSKPFRARLAFNYWTSTISKKLRQETTYHTARVGRMDFLEEIQAPDCIRLFYMHNCITKGLVTLVRTPYGHSTLH